MSSLKVVLKNAVGVKAATKHRSVHFTSIQFISHSTDPIQGHREHMDMEIVRYKIIK
jgi:hypothetical protein